MNRRLATSAACAFTLLLGACGGGDDAAGSDADYLPLATGNRWVYDDGGESLITGQRDAGGQRWWVLQDTQGGNTDEVLLRKDALGVHARVEGSPGGTLQYPLIKLPIAVGTSYPVFSFRISDTDHDGNGTVDDVDLVADATVVAIETVTTPAGTFANTLRLRLSSTSTITYRPSGTRTLLSSGTSDDWFADGIGPVKGHSTDTLASTGAVSTSSYALVGYQIGTRSGGTLAPR